MNTVPNRPNNICTPCLCQNWDDPKHSSSRVTAFITQEDEWWEVPAACSALGKLDPAAVSAATRVPLSWDRAGSSSEIQNNDRSVVSEQLLGRDPKCTSFNIQTRCLFHGLAVRYHCLTKRQESTNQQQFPPLSFIPAVHCLLPRTCRDPGELGTGTAQG